MSFIFFQSGEASRRYVATSLVLTFFVHIFQSGEASRRYESFGRTCKNINPPNDLTAFVKTLHIPDTMTVSKHIFTPPASKPGKVPLQVSFNDKRLL